MLTRASWLTPKSPPLARTSKDLKPARSLLPSRKLRTLGRSESRAAGFSLQPDPAARRGSLLSFGGEHLPRRRQSPARRGTQGNSVRAFGERGCLCNPAHSRRSRRPKSPRRPSSSASQPSPPTPLRRDGISRSIETTRASCSSRWTPRARTRQTTPAPHRENTTADADATAMPPGRAPERAIANPTPAGSPTNRCRLGPATGANDAAATPPPKAASARAGPRPPSKHPRRCARRATASGGHTGQVRARARAGLPSQRRLPRPQRPAPARRRRRSPLPQ
jgi:hypothetical protein